MIESDLPAGLDAAAPVLLWSKGLELWLNHLLRPRLLAFFEYEGRAVLARADQQWWQLRKSLAPSWRNDLLPGTTRDLWSNLARTASNQIKYRNDITKKSMSLRVLGALLLIAGIPDGVAGVKTWSLGLSVDRVRALANGMVVLANQRNALTHQQAGDAETNPAVRGLAFQIMSAAVKIPR